MPPRASDLREAASAALGRAEVTDATALEALVAELEGHADAVEGPLEGFLAHLHGLGTCGHVTAANARQDPDEEPRRLYRLAGALWVDVVAPRLAAAPAGIVALPAGVLEPVLDLRSPGLSVREDGALVNAEGELVGIVPAAEASTADLFLERLAPALTLDGDRVFWWAVREGHARVWRGEDDPRQLRMVGGAGAIAAACGARHHNVLAVLRAMRVPMLVGAGSRQLIALSESPPGPGKPAVVTVTLTDWLLPGAVFQMAKASRADRLRRRLVPYVSLGQLVGKRNRFGLLATFQRRIVLELVLRARELARWGGIGMAPEDWRRLRDLVGLSQGEVDRAVPALFEDGEGAPALLARVDGTCSRPCFTLGPAHDRERQFIEAGGRKALGEGGAKTWKKRGS